MKIAVDCRMLGMSGIGVYLENILYYWLETNKAHSFVLIGDEKKLSKLKFGENCNVVSCSSSVFSFGAMFSFPVKEVNNCDVFYSPTFGIPFGIKVPVYSTIHDVVFLDVKGLVGGLSLLVRKLFYCRAIYASKKIFTVSEFSKTRIKKHFNTNKEIVVAYNGIRHDLFEWKNKKRSYDLYKNYLLYVGNIKRYKGLDILLSAVKAMSDVKLIVVGKYDDMRTSDKELLNESSLNENKVVFVGQKSDEELYSLISDAEALIQPSRYEGFGIPPLEALFLHTKVIISDIPVFKEVYSKLPVIFFENGNSNDLQKKIEGISNEKSPDCIIPEIYSYKNTAAIILKNITIE